MSVDLDMSQFIADLGYDLAALFLESFSGESLYVPKHIKNLKPDHPLIAMLGWDKAYSISAYMGGMDINVPEQLKKKEMSERDKRIVEAKALGASVQNIALEYGLTEKRIYQILSASGRSIRKPHKRNVRRDRQIVKAYKNGETIADIALHSQLSVQHICQVLLDAGCVCAKL